MKLNLDEYHRYSRHLLLDEVGVEGQERLKSARVAVIGAGGLGSPLLLYLAAAGVGRLGLFDFDVVERSNLQRQVIHGESDVGRPKVESARARIAEVNPNVEVVAHQERLESSNALELLEGYDIVVDGTDNFPTRYLLSDACELLGLPMIYASIYRFEGQVSVFNHDGGPSYRDLFPTPPPPGAVPSCAEGGVIGVLPGVIGAIQANEVVKLILGLGETLSGRLLLYNAMKMSFSELRIARNPNRPVVTELIDYRGFCGHVDADPNRPLAPEVGPVEAKRRLDEGWDPFVLDVRAKGELRISSFPNTAMQVSHRLVQGRVDELPRDRDLLIICRMGVRAQTAAATLQDNGFERVIVLAGGMNGWAQRVDPTTPVY